MTAEIVALGIVADVLSNLAAAWFASAVILPVTRIWAQEYNDKLLFFNFGAGMMTLVGVFIIRFILLA